MWAFPGTYFDIARSWLADSLPKRGLVAVKLDICRLVKTKETCPFILVTKEVDTAELGSFNELALYVGILLQSLHMAIPLWIINTGYPGKRLQRPKEMIGCQPFSERSRLEQNWACKNWGGIPSFCSKKRVRRGVMQAFFINRLYLIFLRMGMLGWK